QDYFFFSSRRRHTRCLSDWSSDVCSSDLARSSDMTVGVEEEFSILDPETLELLPRFEQLRDAAAGDEVLGDSITGELISSEIERSEERRVGKECRQRGRVAGQREEKRGID